MADGHVQRLSDWAAEHGDATVASQTLELDVTTPTPTTTTASDGNDDDNDDDNDDENDNEDEDEDDNDHDIGESSSSSSFMPDASAATPRPTVIPTSAVAPLAIKEPKTAWSDTDIRRMIELRAQGFTHEATAVSASSTKQNFTFASYSDLTCLLPPPFPTKQANLGRGKGAVENKYGRVLKEEEWQPYVAQCDARFGRVRRRGKRRAPAEWDEDEDEE